MADPSRDQIPPELLPAARLLTEARPEPTAMELDRAKLTAKARAQKAKPPLALGRKGTLMKSRLVVTALVALGILFSVSGAGLAASGISSSGNASTAQYAPASTTHVTPQKQVTAPSKLPFTGFAAIPVALIGAGMLGAGLTARKRTGKRDDDA